MSSCGRGPRLSVSRRAASAAVASPTGTFSQKIHCQDAPCTIAPPTTGPAATPRPVTPPQMPMAVPRCSTGNASLIRVRVSGTRRAPPAPCTTRAAISSVGIGGQRGQRRAEHEHEQAGDVHPAAAEPVAQRGAGQHQAAEHQAVGVDGPFQLGQAGAELAAQGGQRGRHHDHVERGHERAGRGQRERPAAADGARGRRAGPAGGLAGSVHGVRCTVSRTYPDASVGAVVYWGSGLRPPAVSR